MSPTDDLYTTLTQTLSAGLAGLHTGTPELVRAFNDVGHVAMRPGALDRKTKELIALALGVGTRCDPCIGFHAKALARMGATQEEVDEMLGVTVYMGGGPALMYAVRARAAYHEFCSGVGAGNLATNQDQVQSAK